MCFCKLLFALNPQGLAGCHPAPAQAYVTSQGSRYLKKKMDGSMDVTTFFQAKKNAVAQKRLRPLFQCFYSSSTEQFEITAV